MHLQDTGGLLTIGVFFVETIPFTSLTKNFLVEALGLFHALLALINGYPLLNTFSYFVIQHKVI